MMSMTMTEGVGLFAFGLAMSAIVAYYTSAIATEKRVASLETSIRELSRQIENASESLGEQIALVRDELRTYYQRRPGR